MSTRSLSGVSFIVESFSSWSKCGYQTLSGFHLHSPLQGGQLRATGITKKPESQWSRKNICQGAGWSLSFQKHGWEEWEGGCIWCSWNRLTRHVLKKRPGQQYSFYSHLFFMWVSVTSEFCLPLVNKEIEVPVPPQYCIVFPPLFSRVHH